VLERTLGAPGSTGEKTRSAEDITGSTEDNPGSTWERQREVWKHLESQ